MTRKAAALPRPHRNPSWRGQHAPIQENVRNEDSLASEIVAFANSEGGTIFMGVADDGSVPGLSPEDVKRINHHLPDNLTVENIRTGNFNLRNPILASYIAKGLLPYRGLGSGVPRALESWPEIDFRDDRDGCLFVGRFGEKKPPTRLETHRRKVRRKFSACSRRTARRAPASARPLA